MDASAARVSATCIGKWAVDLAMLTEAASREAEPCLIEHRKEQVLDMIGRLRRELTELECAVKGMPLPAPVPPKPALALVSGD